MYHTNENPNGGTFKSVLTQRTYAWRNTPDGSDRRRALRDMQADDAKAGGFKPLSREERRAQRLAEQNGRLEASHVQRIAAQEAAATAPPENPWTKEVQVARQRAYTPEGRRRLERFERFAAEWDAKNSARIQAEEQAANIPDDVRRAREYVNGWERTVPPEFRLEAVKVRAFIEASSDGAEAWRRIEAFRDAQYAAQDRETAAKMAEAGASRDAFERSAAKSEADRAAHEAARPKPEPPRDDAGKFVKAEPLPSMPPDPPNAREEFRATN